MTKQTGLQRAITWSAAFALLVVQPETALSQNPVPVITSVSPNSFTAGSTGFALTVNGRSFVRSSIVRWNGADKRTQYVSAGQLVAEITPEDASQARVPSITVFNPAPGGGTSGIASLALNSTTIDPALHPNPVPVLSSLSPNSILVGHAQFVLLANGSNFVSTSRLYWANSVDGQTSFRQQTYYNSPSDVRIIVPAEFVSVEGRKALVKVINPTPGGGTSNQLEFHVLCKARSITSARPNYVVSGQAFQVTATGENFGAGDRVKLGGADLTLVSRSSTSFVAQVPVELATAGNAALSVVDPCGTATHTVIHIWPPPAITSISPATVRAFDPPFTLTVTGTSFLGLAKVRLQGIDKPTTVVDATALRATIAASDLTQIGNLAVAVYDPTLGVSSAARSLTVGYPVPLPASLDPASIRSGGGSFTLTVNGSRLYPSSTILWDGSQRPTTYVSPTRLTVAIPADDIQRTSPPSDRTVQVQVRSGNETSQALTFTITKQ